MSDVITVDIQDQRRVVTRQKTIRDYLDLYRHVPYYMLLLTLVYGVMYPHYTDVLVLDTDKLTESWRLYSYSLLHVDVAHLVSNLVMMLILGLCLNVAHGNMRLLGLHTVGVVGGAFGVEWEKLLFNVDRIRVIGASGGVYALMGGHIGNVAINWSEMPFRWIRTSLLLLMILMDVFLYVFYYNALISYSCHVGGFISGAMCGPLVLKNVRFLRWERYLKWTCAILIGSYLVASSGLHISLATH